MRHGIVDEQRPVRGHAPRADRRGRSAAVRARLHRVERRQHQRAARRRAPADDAEERLQGIHDAGHDVHHGSRRHEAGGRPRCRRRRCRCTSRSTDSGRTSQAVVHAHPPTATGFAVAGIPLDRAVLAEVVTTLGSIPIADYATPSTKELPEAVRKYVKAHDGMLLANHGALTLGSRLFARLLQDGDDRAFRARSASWRGCSAASGCCRVRRSTGCRGCAACTASRRRRRFAPIRTTARRRSGRLPDRAGAADADGERLVADALRGRRRGRRRGRTGKFG